MTISVLIPTFNRAHLLARAINSVLNQTVLVDEIIVIDDGSTDETADLVTREFPQITLIKQENKGVSATRNAGILKATGDWVALLDSDDEWIPSKIELQTEFIEQQEDCVLLHTNETWIRNGKRVNKARQHQKFGGRVFIQCVDQCFISPSTAMIRKDIFDEIGLFDENLLVCEDYDLWIRIASKHSIHFLDEELIVKYGGHADQLSTQLWGMDRFRVRAIVNLLEQNQIMADDEVKYAIEIGLKKCALLKLGAQKHSNKELVAQMEEFENILAAFR